MHECEVLQRNKYQTLNPSRLLQSTKKPTLKDVLAASDNHRRVVEVLLKCDQLPEFGNSWEILEKF